MKKEIVEINNNTKVVRCGECGEEITLSGCGGNINLLKRRMEEHDKEKHKFYMLEVRII